jgi:hypothetical protein
VFEIVRHGARAAFTEYEPFTKKGMTNEQLTATGARQRFLLGRYTMKKYGADLGINDLMTP